jgi:macrolide transport system ATP-binding/permease protein
MDWLAQVFRKLRLLTGRERFKRELEEEMAFHREQMEGKMLTEGISEEGARYAALRQFGNATRMKEMSHEVMAFRMETVAQDMGFAARQMRKNPGFAATAIFVLTLGIGAAIAIFSFVDAALIRPLPYQDSSSLVILYESNTLGPHFHLSYFDYLDYLHRNKVFQSLDAYAPYGFMQQTPTGAQPAHGARVTAGFFRTLGVTPILGRDFRSDDDQPAAPFVTLISYAAWQHQFAGRTDVLGQTVVLDGAPTTIIGVLPRDFHFAPAEPSDFWATERPDRECEKVRGCHNLLGVARLRRGVSLEAALTEAQKIAEQIAQQYPGDDHGRGATMMPLAEAVLGNIRPILLALFAGAVLLLLISAINVASLLLVRSERRRQEMAVRGALGASRIRLIRQFVTEGIMLAASAGVLGIALADLATRLLLSLFPKDVLATMPYLSQISLNPRVLAFTVLVTVAAGMIFSLLPALRLSLADLRAGLSEGSRGTSGVFWRRFGSNMVVVELTMTVVLLVGAGLLGKSLYRLLHVDLGFVPDRVAILQVAATSNAYSGPQQQISFFLQLDARLAAIPGVRSTASADEFPIGDGDGSSNFRIVGRAWPSEHNEVLIRDSSAGYFSTLQTRLLRGRYFTDSEDTSHARVVLINHEMAKTYFPGEDPIGKQIYIEGSANKAMEIVGIVEDIQEGQPDAAPRSAMYRPLYQNPQDPKDGFAVALRTEQDEDSVLATAATTIHSLDPGLAVYDPGTMAERLHDSPAASLHRAAAYLVGGFAGLAFLLSSIGLYGVIAYSVSQRTKEIGVRMALGAQRSSVYRLILGEAGRLAVAGIGAGVLCSLAATMLIRKLLFDVHAWDASILVSVAVVLAAAALLASYLPARRAASVNPTEALHAE